MWHHREGLSEDGKTIRLVAGPGNDLREEKRVLNAQLRSQRRRPMARQVSSARVLVSGSFPDSARYPDTVARAESLPLL
jgi:hypothetical protein